MRPATRDLAWMVRLYPRWWRDRYGDEMSAMLETTRASPAIVAGLVRGALDARLLGDDAPPRGAPLAMVLAGGAWTVAGAATAVAPAPPDWPGYLVETLPLGVVGACAALVGVVAVARRGWMAAGRAAELLVVAAVLTHVAWAGSLVAAVLGGPYGAVTAAIPSLAALATVGVGSMRTRAGDHLVGAIVLVAGVAFLLPAPIGWLIAGAAWTGLGIVSLVGPGRDDRRVPH